jgi:hypothetical protein
MHFTIPALVLCYYKSTLGLNVQSSSKVVVHCNENPFYVFIFWELRGLSPNFHIHVSVSDLYIPKVGPHIFLQQNR